MKTRLKMEENIKSYHLWKIEFVLLAMNEEINELEEKSTWEIVDRQGGKKTIGCRWIDTIKHK